MKRIALVVAGYSTCALAAYVALTTDSPYLYRGPAVLPGLLFAAGAGLVWFASRIERNCEIQDGDFGILVFDGHFWRGASASAKIPIFFKAGREGIDASQQEAALQAIRDLAQMQSVAREFLTTDEGRDPWPTLKLSAIEVVRPARDWVRNMVAKQNPEAASAILDGAAVVSLQFEITGDKNVVDVVFLRRLPVAWDYH